MGRLAIPDRRSGRGCGGSAVFSLLPAAVCGGLGCGTVPQRHRGCIHLAHFCFLRGLQHRLRIPGRLPGPGYRIVNSVIRLLPSPLSDRPRGDSLPSPARGHGRTVSLSGDVAGSCICGACARIFPAGGVTYGPQLRIQDPCDPIRASGGEPGYGGPTVAFRSGGEEERRRRTANVSFTPWSSH